MIVWHVTTLAKLEQYFKSGGIHPPVRAWKTFAGANRFSVQTGRKVIIRLQARGWEPLGGHNGEAMVSYRVYKLMKEDV